MAFTTNIMFVNIADCITIFILFQYLGESLSNEQKAIVFEQTVPCHNNISLCCMQLKSYGESAQFAKNVSMRLSCDF
jgi:hypothetical protein